MTARAAALAVTTDLALGGRWTSLTSSGPRGRREWLWRNPGITPAQRAAVRPGTPFVDAGGGEECLPSVVGDPARGHDHGDVWSRPWVGESVDARARTRDGVMLRRRLGDRGGTVRVDYDVTAPPGTPFLHAVHLLLDLSDAARVVVAGTPAVAVQDRPHPGAVTRTTWPDGDGVPLDRLGPPDGTARCAVVMTDAVEIHDGDDVLRFRWGAPPDVPTSLVLWRNLGGWPADGPYRSIGVEPMVGATTALHGAGPDDVASTGPAGVVSWWLELAASTT